MKNIYSIRPKGFNIGNDVIYLGINHFIRMAFKENYNIISLPATGKYEAHRKAGLSSQTIYEVNQFGHGLIVGGGNLYENGELEVNPIALKALEKPMMIFSVSRGKVYNRALELVDRTDTMADEKLKLLHQYTDISLSRDKATKTHLDSLGCDNTLGGCPTLFINEIPQHLVPIMDTDKTDTLISIRTPTLMSIPVEYQYRLRDQLTEMIALLKRKGYQNVKFLCHDHRDIPFAASFEEIDYLYTEDVYTYLTYLRNTRLNVTFRLHSFIPCLSYDVPAIKISYDQRALSMLETLDMDDWNIDLLKDNLMVELEHRLNNLQDLETLKSQRQNGRWAELRNTMVENSEKFAALVNERI
ncbi:polysaccharide pyruvyl transferase family protein [Parapedobacter koreensis]|uniref:Polysaccharide pyruvyl transferase family protein WcaK n=1 Tax=Parapedobacter koreensis TaxID=332977 RepID=A0A1H7T650_9SPHI|nr:polysaccharide pyruvyl transferase family protein [Parapedobacter koreensis]SEL80283.1 Polysaccharide pyruvyl transferase family protein WcaK [Parapedobacter koreensis]